MAVLRRFGCAVFAGVGPTRMVRQDSCTASGSHPSHSLTSSQLKHRPNSKGRAWRAASAFSGERGGRPRPGSPIRSLSRQTTRAAAAVAAAAAAAAAAPSVRARVEDGVGLGVSGREEREEERGQEGRKGDKSEKGPRPSAHRSTQDNLQVAVLRPSCTRRAVRHS
jgi:hypothetical protein